MKMSFEDLEKMSKIQLKRILEEKIKYEALEFLKKQQLQQEKIKNLEFMELKMQDYLMDGDRNTLVSKTIFKARGKILDIKTQQKWKYEDNICVGCQVNIESGEEILQCNTLGKNEKEISYDWFYSDMVKKQIEAGKLMIKKLRKRRTIREGIT